MKGAIMLWRGFFRCHQLGRHASNVITSLLRWLIRGVAITIILAAVAISLPALLALPPGSILACAVCLPAAIFITVVGHELGHVIFGGLAGYTFERVSFGSGRNLLSWRMGKTLIEINTGINAGQIAPRSARYPDSGFCQMLFHLGGVLANFAMMMGALLLFMWFAMPVWAKVAIASLMVCNLYYMVESLWPYTHRDDDGIYYEMDGYQVLLTWRVGPKQADQYDYRSMVTPFFTDESEAAPSPAARELVQLVKAISAVACQGDAKLETYNKSLASMLARGRLTKAEELLVLDVLGAPRAIA
jgi:hypothetical protein